MILPNWETDFAAARDMKCSNSRNDNALIIRGRIYSQGYSNLLSRGPEYEWHRMKIITQGKEMKLDNLISNFFKVFQGSDKATVSVVFRGQILYRYYQAYLQFRPICD